MASASRLKIGVLAAAACAAAGYAAVWMGALPAGLATMLGLQPRQAAEAPASTPAASAAAPGRPGGAGGAVPARPPVSVLTAKSERNDMPVRFEAIGSVQTIASVTLRSRVDSQIVDVAFQDGARVKQGDILFRLDARQIDAQIAQAEANVIRDKAALVSADADFRRTDALSKRDFATEKTLDTARATAAGLRATILSGEAQVENLKVQRSYYTISAPISGRIGVAGLKLGNIARSGDSSTLLGVINQIAPIYVSFAMPQRYLPEIRAAMVGGTARAMATPQGSSQGVEGSLAVIDNSVDATTGTLTMRAMFENGTELLWPGALCQVRLTLRTEPNALVIPREAVQSGQNGTFVFEVVEGVARARSVKVDRTVDNLTVVSSGLNGGETIVIDGQQLLADGSRVNVRPPAGSPAPASGKSGPAAGRPKPSDSSSRSPG